MPSSPRSKPDSNARPLEACVAIVLAAGRGSRMGGPKALMTILPNGQEWWEVQAARLKHAGVVSVWVVSDSVRKKIDGKIEAMRLLVTADSAAPMFASFLTGLAAWKQESLAREWTRVDHQGGVFVQPIDTPVPDAAVWAALAATGRVAVPSCLGVHGHPVFLPWTWITSILEPAIAAVKDASTLRLDHLIAPFAQYVDVSDPTVSLNLNTPADAKAYLDGAHP